MCGILALVSLGVAIDSLLSANKGSSGKGGVRACSSTEGCVECVPDEVRRLFPSLYRRGPDTRGCFLFRDLPFAQGWQHGSASGVPRGGGGALWSSVLHLQGEVMCDQPVSDSYGNALCWNGEVFGGEVLVPPGASDTLMVFERLTQAIRDAREGGGKEEDAIGSDGSSSSGLNSYTATRDSIANVLGGIEASGSFPALQRILFIPPNLLNISPQANFQGHQT